MRRLFGKEFCYAICDVIFHSSRFLSEQSRRPSTAFKKIFGRAFPTEATGSLNRKRVSIRGSLNRSRSMIVSDSSKQSKTLSLVCILIHVSRIFIDGPSPTYSKQSSIDEDEISHHSTPSGCEKKSLQEFRWLIFLMVFLCLL